MFFSPNLTIIVLLKVKRGPILENLQYLEKYASFISENQSKCSTGGLKRLNTSYGVPE